jgi:hypothetical protein
VGAPAAAALAAALELNRDAFVIDHGVKSTVDLAAHRRASALPDLDLADGDERDSVA